MWCNLKAHELEVSMTFPCNIRLQTPEYRQGRLTTFPVISHDQSQDAVCDCNLQTRELGYSRTSPCLQLNTPQDMNDITLIF